MDLEPTSNDRPWRDRLIIVVACCLLWLPLLAGRVLWHPDEPRFALLTLGMLQTGEYVAPLKMGEVYSSKPLLHLWATAAVSAALGGVDEISMRIPSFLTALLCVLATYALGTAMFGARAGLFAALVLATDVRYLTQAGWASTDILLCFFMTAALVCFHAGYRTRQGRWYLLTHLFCALGTLTKGPVGFVLPGLIVLVFLIAQRDLHEILRLRLVEAILITLALVGPWLMLYARRAGGDDTWTLLVTENIHRYLHAWNNEHPWHYYLWRFPVDFLPWTLVLPAAVWYSRTLEAKERRFLWIWFAVVFLFYSASRGKRGVYILPLHPPAAILVGWFWDRAARASWPGANGWLRAGRWGMGGTFAVLGASMAWMAPRLIEGLDGAGRVGVTLWALLTSTAGIAIILQPAKRTIALTALAIALASAGIAHGVAASTQREELTEFAAEIARQVPADAPLGIVTHAEELAFYAVRIPAAELRPGKLMRRWLETPGTIYMLLDEECLDDLRSRSGQQWEALAERKLWKGDFHVVVRRSNEEG